MKLEAVRQFALSLAEATEAPHHHYSSFRVKGRIFVTVPPEHTHIHVFVSEAVREPALAMDPAFLDKLLWGGKVVGLRVALAGATPAVVKSLVQQAYDDKAAAAGSSRKRTRPVAADDDGPPSKTHSMRSRT